ncbi:hypothetical protein SB717_38260, partial [Priestia sp. SIMBA_032]|uniref:hypothetical protein n=1 Tax=Priestia sp. SIMBA_032 TaxID=3085775 RepID=UPI003978B0EE
RFTRSERDDRHVLQLPAIVSAACGYWNPTDPVKPELDTKALRDVAALYRRYSRSLQIIQDLNITIQELRESGESGTSS